MSQAPSPIHDAEDGIAVQPSSVPQAETGDPPRPLPRRGLERLDLLLLSLEALDLNGGEAMVWLSEQLGYQSLFPNRVELWKHRCHNPLRRACRRGALGRDHSDALIHILCLMADRLYPLLRALLSSQEPPELTRERWQLFQERLSALLRERMNPRRSGVQTLLDPVAGEAQRLSLVRTLALATGSGGVDRLRASLLDAAA
ncbi:MAG: DUF3038 domain-containing protein [Cyanobium sp.]